MLTASRLSPEFQTPLARPRSGDDRSSLMRARTLFSAFVSWPPPHPPTHSMRVPLFCFTLTHSFTAQDAWPTASIGPVATPGPAAPLNISSRTLSRPDECGGLGAAAFSVRAPPTSTAAALSLPAATCGRSPPCPPVPRAAVLPVSPTSFGLLRTPAATNPGALAAGAYVPPPPPLSPSAARCLPSFACLPWARRPAAPAAVPLAGGRALGKGRALHLVPREQAGRTRRTRPRRQPPWVCGREQQQQ